MITTLPGHMNTPASDNVDSTHTMNPFNQMKQGMKKITRQVKGMRRVTTLPTGMKTSAHKPIYSKPTIFDRRKMNIPQVREALDLDSIFKHAYAVMISEVQFGPSATPMSAAPIGGAFPIQKDNVKTTIQKHIRGNSLVDKTAPDPSSKFNMNPKTLLKPVHPPKDNTAKRNASWTSR